MTTVSVAIPCYKSALTIPSVVNDIRAAIHTREDFDYQIILVCDSPGDDTFDAITRLCREDPHIIGVNLSRNFGQTTAKLAALPYVTGDVLVFMDDDGQHPADQLPRLVDKVLDGYDLVYAHFLHKKHSLFKRATSWLNGKILEINGSKPKGIVLSSFMAMSPLAVEALRKYKSPFPAVGEYLSHVICRYANVDMEHHERIAGKSNYTLSKLLRMWFTGFTNFSTVPLHIASLIGGLFAVGGGLTGLIIVIRKLVNPNIAAGYTSSICLQLFIGGIIILILGLIGEYIGRIYMTVSDMPQYRIRETLNTDTPRDRE